MNINKYLDHTPISTILAAGESTFQDCVSSYIRYYDRLPSINISLISWKASPTILKSNSIEEVGNNVEFKRVGSLYFSTKDSFGIERNYKAEKKPPLTEMDLKLFEYGIKSELTEALLRYVSRTDKVVDVSFYDSSNVFGVEINLIIERGGEQHNIITEMIQAGGYNIQKFHYRYIVKTNLYKLNTNLVKRIDSVLKIEEQFEQCQKEVLKCKAKLESLKVDKITVSQYLSKKYGDAQKILKEKFPVAHEDLVRRYGEDYLKIKKVRENHYYLRDISLKEDYNNGTGMVDFNYYLNSLNFTETELSKVNIKYDKAKKLLQEAYQELA